MNNIKLNPLFQGKNFNHLLEDVFSRSISDFVGSDFSVTSPAVNIAELDDHFTIDVAAPGLEKKDFSIVTENNQLVISATKESDPVDGKWTRKEFDYNSFRRVYQLSDDVDTSKIHAEYNNGILTLVLPKKEEAKAKSPVKIEIK